MVALGSGPVSLLAPLPSEFPILAPDGASFPLRTQLGYHFLHQNLSTFLTPAWFSLLGVSIRPHASPVWPFFPLFVIVTQQACAHRWTVSFFTRRPTSSIFLSSTSSHEVFTHQLLWAPAMWGCARPPSCALKKSWNGKEWMKQSQFFFKWGDETILAYEVAKNHKRVGRQFLFPLALFSEVKLHAVHGVRSPRKILTLRHLHNAGFENLDQTPGSCLRRRAKKSIRGLVWKQILFIFLKIYSSVI